MAANANHHIDVDADFPRDCLIIKHRETNNNEGDGVRLKVKPGETVEWCTQEQGTLTITFDGPNPFNSQPNYKVQTQNCISATVSNSASDRYKYTLELSTNQGNVSEDPQVIIDDGNVSFFGVLLRVLAFIGLGISTFSFFGERFFGQRGKPRN